MRKETYKKLEGMSDCEIMYIVASEYIDEICYAAVINAVEIMQNPILRNMICQAAESILRYEEKRKQVMLDEIAHDDFWYVSERDTIKAYKTVLYDNIFYKYGANIANV